MAKSAYIPTELDDCFEQVRGDILHKESMPNLEECYALIRREANCCLTFKGESENSEAAAMMTLNKTKTNNGAAKLAYKCTRCNQFGHTKECCYELVGYPNCSDHNLAPQRRNTKKTRPIVSAVETNRKDGGIKTTSAMIAMAGNGGKSFCASTPVSNITWIIDSGATNHMTFDSRQVTKIKPSLQNFSQPQMLMRPLLLEKGL